MAIRRRRYRRWLIAALFAAADPLVRDPRAHLEERVHGEQRRPELAARGTRATRSPARFEPVSRPGARRTVWVAAPLATAVAAVRRELTDPRARRRRARSGSLIEIAVRARRLSVGTALHVRGRARSLRCSAGVFVGWLILALPPLITGATRRIRASVPRSRDVGAWGTGLVVVAIAGSMFGFLHRQYRLERVDLGHERNRAVLINRLSTVVRRSRDASHPLVRAAAHPDRVPERPRLVHGHQDRRAVREPAPRAAPPPPARQHLPHPRAGMESAFRAT